jgi:pimeloyl-ACP methyl ester carboxylesterase
MSDSPETLHEIWYESAGTRLFAVERGHGSPVVFLHGGLADHRASWFRLGSLAASHRLITPDVRGSGRSLHAGALDWDLLADDVVALMQHLRLDRAVVGGTSAGSGVALRLALRHPARVRALLVVSPVFAGEDAAPMQASHAAMQRMAEAGRRAETEGIAAILSLFEALPPAIRDVALAMARSFDRLAELAALSMPTLVVPGTDPEHPAEVAERYARVIPGAVLASPSPELGRAVETFLRSLDEDAPPR